MKNDCKIILQCRSRSGGTVSFAAGPLQSLGGELGGKVPGLFISGG